MTDFENAALVTFLVLLSRVILEKVDVDFLVPISRVDENMRRAQRRGACLSEKFYFRTRSGEMDELSIDEIINGEEGLMTLVRDYVARVEMEENTRKKIDGYLKLVSDKASGRCKTTAAWMRDFITSHAKYEFDSVVNEEIAYDLMWNCCQIANGLFECPELYGG